MLNILNIAVIRPTAKLAAQSDILTKLADTGAARGSAFIPG